MPVQRVRVRRSTRPTGTQATVSARARIIVTVVPGVDLAKTGTASITDLARSLDPNAPIVLIDVTTGERVPYWAELDTWNSRPGDTVARHSSRPQLRRGHRIVVALRNMKNAAGNIIPPSPAFQMFRDHRRHVRSGDR